MEHGGDSGRRTVVGMSDVFYPAWIAGRPVTTGSTAEVFHPYDGSVVGAHVVPTADQVEEALAAQALDRATTVYETQGYDAAKRVLDERLEQMNQNVYLAPAARARLAGAAWAALGHPRAAGPCVRGRRAVVGAGG